MPFVLVGGVCAVRCSTREYVGDCCADPFRSPRSVEFALPVGSGEVLRAVYACDGDWIVTSGDGAASEAGPEVP